MIPAIKQSFIDLQTSYHENLNDFFIKASDYTFLGTLIACLLIFLSGVYILHKYSEMIYTSYVLLSLLSDEFV